MLVPKVPVDIAFDFDSVLYFILQVNMDRPHITRLPQVIYSPCGSCLMVFYSPADTILHTDPLQN